MHPEPTILLDDDEHSQDCVLTSSGNLKKELDCIAYYYNNTLMNTSVTIFQVSPSSGAPIFRQLMDQIKRLIACGQLQSGQTLPSVREAAGQLSVNPMTISKAYNHLELEGVVERRNGVGMLVKASGPDEVDDRLKLLEPAMSELLLQARQLDLGIHEVVDRLKELKEN